MLISCVSRTEQIVQGRTGVVVFPERVAQDELETAQSANPASVIVGAVLEDRRCRGYVFHRGKNQINYLKVLDDIHAKGSGIEDQSPLYQFSDVALGVLICRDIQHVSLFRHVVHGLRSSTCNLKLLCIPAAMDCNWFSTETLLGYEGFHVLVCNHPTAHQVRCKSFITNVANRKTTTQQEVEPIYAELP